MDPISSLVAGHVAGKIIDSLAAQFRQQVIERWSRRRAQEFFAAFCTQCVADSGLVNDAEVQLSLEKILSNEQASEVLFEAYRRVALARSRKLGPRIIGLLTARLVGHSRGANEEEETIFSVAETLADEDLRGFAQFFVEERSRIGTHGTTETDNGLNVRLTDDQVDSNWPSRESRSVGPLDLSVYFGASWPRKLAALGVLLQDTREQDFDYEPDSTRGADMPGTIREVTWWLHVPRAYYELVDLVQRADWPDTDGKSEGATAGR